LPNIFGGGHGTRLMVVGDAALAVVLVVAVAVAIVVVELMKMIEVV